jgi:MFS transporter, ACDE family, multidrug resistance protein
MTAPGGEVARAGAGRAGAHRPPRWFIYSVTLTGILANTLPTAPLPDILEAFGQPDERAGWFVAAGTVPGIVLAPLVGVLADRYGRRKVLVPCLLVFSAFGAASALAPSFGILLACRLLQGFGSAGLINLAVVLIGDHWSGVERAKLIGFNAAVLTVSIAVLPTVGGRLAELGSWRLSFTPYLLGFVTAVVAARSLPAGAPHGGARLREQVTDALAVVRRPKVGAAIAFGFVLFVLIFGLFLTVLPVHLENEFGLAAGERGMVLAAPAAGATLAALSLGRLQRFGRARLLVAANLLFVAGFATIGTADAILLLLAGAALYGLGEGIAIPTVQDLVAGSAPEASRAAVVALWVGAARAGQTAGPLLAGVGIDRIGTGGTFVAGACLAGALLLAQLLVPVRRLDRVAALAVEGRAGSV